VELLLKDGLGLVDLKLGLQVSGVVREAAAVGATSSVGEAEVFIHYFISKATPITLAAAVLLDLFGVCVEMAILGKESRKMLCWGSSAVREALVVSVVGLVRASHFDKRGKVVGKYRGIAKVEGCDVN